MSTNDWVVIVAGLALGFGLVWLLMGGKKAVRIDDPSEGVESSSSSSSSTPSWSVVLGVAPSATEAEIRAAYRRLMSQYHPDKVAALGSELRELAERKSKEIGTAYATALRARGVE